MKDLANQNITVALIPCGGTYTMDFDEATDSAVDIQPEIAVPMHNWGKDLNEFKELLNKKDPNIKVEILTDKSLKV
jgi:L-ascorbate metabolism protein UlaG (beta-lactamase superfamily)